jgi:hypothetical protein
VRVSSSARNVGIIELTLGILHFTPYLESPWAIIVALKDL